MTSETAAFLSTGCAFTALLVLLIGTAVGLIKRKRPGNHRHLWINDGDPTDVYCAVCGRGR